MFNLNFVNYSPLSGITNNDHRNNGVTCGDFYEFLEEVENGNECNIQLQYVVDSVNESDFSNNVNKLIYRGVFSDETHINALEKIFQ